MVSCAVARCKNSSAKSTKCKDGITFHRFPQDERRRKTWEIAVNREPEWAPTDSSTVCSEHFEIKDFYFTESGLRRLSSEATPTINISKNNTVTMVGKRSLTCSKCGVSSKENSSLTFHRFPLPSVHGSLKAKVWAKYCFPNADWTSDQSLSKLYKKNIFVCGTHFDDSSFTNSERTRLNKFAIPTDAQNILAQVRDEILNSQPDMPVCEDHQPTISQKPQIDIKPTDSAEVIQLKHKVRRLELIAKNRKKHINLLWQSKKRMQKKMDQMKAVIEHLIEGREKGNTL